ncbi:hypothetical protein DJ568_00200 [Mucilaginibacter hurinus]|uniref:Ricin B lectin domain-containing protein n=1 Tax=Mucilaginibacter hurinus TaxID=2201324 RepID=A0A367GU43_9SPHI|nr:RICIN domain-containing protein [Mucilaginibacter hurinus]RCH56321.1 hypothetical protein DJ568_00200 [Mucilaginibacter hurinus]
MKIKILIYAVALVFIGSGCKKTESVKNTDDNSGAPVTDIARSSGLKINVAPGAYFTYQVMSSVNGKSGRISNFSLDNGGFIELADYNGASHQKWRITFVGDGYYKIMNLGSGKVLQAYDNDGTQLVIQNSANNSDAQLWRISPVSGKLYKALSKSTGLAISANTNGPSLLEPYTGKPSQLWGYNVLQNDSYRDDAVVNFFHRTNKAQGSVAFDQGNSIALTWGPNAGKVLWIAEDSFDGVRLKDNGNLLCGFFQYNNSVLIQPASRSWDPELTDNLTISNSTQGRPRQVFNAQPGTDFTWPGVGVEVGNKVYVYGAELKSLKLVHQALYEMVQSASNNAWQINRFLPVGMDQANVVYSEGMVKPGDGYVYAYGNMGVFIVKYIYVARFKESDPLTWTFWDGSKWVDKQPITKPTTKEALHFVGKGEDVAAYANTAISYHNGKYIMMQMDFGYGCDNPEHNIYISTSTSPTGPFTQKKKVFTIEDRYRGHIAKFYTPAIHPEFDNGNKELLLTYCLNFSGCNTGDDCRNGELDSRQYQIKGIRVPYSLIGL